MLRLLNIIVTIHYTAKAKFSSWRIQKRNDRSNTSSFQLTCAHGNSFCLYPSLSLGAPETNSTMFCREEPIQELELTYDSGNEVECLLDAVKAHYRATVPAKSPAQLAAQKAELISKLPQETPLDEKLLNIATNLQMVENIALLSNSKEYDFIGINLYTDDEGAIRGSPRNIRASEIAHCCGRPIQVRGDAFLARVLDNGDDFLRLDFDLKDVSSGAPWIQQAKEQAYKRREAESSADVMRRLQEERQGGHGRGVVRELTPAESAKEDGNIAFKKGKWEEAVAHYTRALKLEPMMLAAANNRAMAELKLGWWPLALDDCLFVLEQQPSNIKALLRAATAEKELEHIHQAKKYLNAVLTAEPGNKEAKEKLEAWS